MTGHNVLKQRLIDSIKRDGPMPLEDFMATALTHPQHGYYTTRDPLGRAGDFITAPEISQVFGELLGLWGADLWSRMGCPENLNLIELGPGRGTLMQDILRVAEKLPGFADTLSVHFVETSPVLQQAQAKAVAAYPVSPSWHADIPALLTALSADAPPAPCLIYANEFFDALPIRQYVKNGTGWSLRHVGLTQTDALSYIDIACTDKPETNMTAEDGDILETCPTGAKLLASLAAHIKTHGGGALVIDYGYGETAFGDSFQALEKHQQVHPLASPGTADLTAHVNFQTLAATAHAAGCAVHGPVTQRHFLQKLGIEARFNRLKQNAEASLQTSLAAAQDRLTATDQMGALFKVMALTAPDTAVPDGFASPNNQDKNTDKGEGESEGEDEA
jgi:SAM-dependent MidA family methyltransferase